MAELKTKVNNASVSAFLDKVDDEQKRDDCYSVLKIMEEVSGSKPKMWGDSIVGFDSYHYKSKSGQEGDWMVTGFSPRKQNLTLYIMAGFEDEGLMQQLGKYKNSKSCLYLKRLDDVDPSVLKKLIKASIKKTKNLYSDSE